MPLNLRRVLSAESAANDGLAYPFLSISIYLTIESSRRVAIGEWFLVGWLCTPSFSYRVRPLAHSHPRPGHLRHRHRCGVRQVILPTASSERGDTHRSTGLGFSHLMKFSHRKGYIDRESYVAQYLALALFTIGVTRTLGSDDLLAAFAAGMLFPFQSRRSTRPQTVYVICRFCHQLGRPFQHPDRGRGLFLGHRPCAELRVFHLYWRVDAVQHVQRTGALSYSLAPGNCVRRGDIPASDSAAVVTLPLGPGDCFMEGGALLRSFWYVLSTQPIDHLPVLTSSHRSCE